MKIGFLGMGNMARAIAQGFLKSGRVQPQDVSACALRFDRLRAFCEPLGIAACETAGEMIARSDVVVIAVKPYLVEGLLSEHRSALAGKAIWSVAAGYPLEKLRPLVDESTRVQFIMPNTPCAVGAGMLLFEEETTLTPAERDEAVRLFEALGEVAILPSRQMPAGMAVSGCGPAFVAMMIEALADAGVKYGLTRATAYRLASQTVAGTGALQLATGDLPAAIKDAVCSPGGTTIRGVEALEKRGMRYAFMEAVGATLK